MVHSDCLVLREDPSTFEGPDLCKYFQNFTQIWTLKSQWVLSQY